MFVVFIQNDKKYDFLFKNLKWFFWKKMIEDVKLMLNEIMKVSHIYLSAFVLSYRENTGGDRICPTLWVVRVRYFLNGPIRKEFGAQKNAETPEIGQKWHFWHSKWQNLHLLAHQFDTSYENLDMIRRQFLKHIDFCGVPTHRFRSSRSGYLLPV